jgi:rare lipoprotein A
MVSRNAVIAVSLSLCLAGCAKKPPRTGEPLQEGIASWYGRPFDGRLTASGEIYDMEKMTAAHRTLPFGTVLQVENLVNGKTIEVRINDRGPFVQDRIIDLSHAASQAISMPGIANVRLYVISSSRTRAPEVFSVQVGTFSERPEAEKARARLEQKYGTAKLIWRNRDQTWSVLVGAQPTSEGADALAAQIEKDAGPAFVVLADPAP